MHERRRPDSSHFCSVNRIRFPFAAVIAGISVTLQRQKHTYMPDGKPDRHILPYTSFRSGLRAGRAQERECAAKAFSLFAADAAENAAEEEKMKVHFLKLLAEEEDKLG